MAKDVRSLRNVGALFRSCDAAGVSELVLAGYTGAPPRGQISKVALGAEEHVPWSEARSPLELELRVAGTFVVVLEQHPRSVRLDELELPPDRDVTLVACEELFGADDEVLDLADAIVELPMRGSKQSENVAVAAAVALHGLADRMWGTTDADLASRQPARATREGVLTRGVTAGELPVTPRG